VAGAVGLEGLTLIIDPAGAVPYGPFYDSSFEVRAVLNEISRSAMDAVLLRVFEELFRISGYARPINLFGFPA
jgi:hypothetical protein